MRHSYKYGNTKLYTAPNWHIFHILDSENVDDVISRVFTVVSVYANSQGIAGQVSVN